MDISGTWNVRDVGGAASPAGSTTPLREGVLIRTASLSRLDDAGRSALHDLGVTTVLDLRGPDEVARDGADAVGPGVAVLHRAMDPGAAMAGDGTATADTAALVQRLIAADDPASIARGLMQAAYATFVEDGAVRAAVGRALTDLAHAPGASVVHCSAGKDRTGWIVALVQYLCGVDDDARLAEYLRSADAADEMAARIPPIPGLGPDALRPIITVEDDYLLSAWGRAATEFGSVDRYVEACGLSALDRDTLVARFV